jgi:hypothetical protein
MVDKQEELRQSKERLQAIFAKNPELKKAFRETLDEMSKPENIDKMVKDICTGLNNLKKGVDNYGRKE